MAEKFSDYALAYINALGGKDNIDTLINCATRIRVTVKNPSLVAADSEFKNWGGKLQLPDMAICSKSLLGWMCLRSWMK